MNKFGNSGKYAKNIENVKIGSDIFNAIEIMNRDVYKIESKIEFSKGEYETLDSTCYLQIKFPDIYSNGIWWTYTKITFDGKNGKVLEKCSYFP